jgi:DnaJ family protein C protein 28
MTDEQVDSENNAETRAQRRARMRQDWSNLIEDLIEEGRQQGAFDDLPGKGKPLKLDKKPFGRETELAHNLLKRNDLTPAWIAHRSQLLEKTRELREEIQRIWQRHERAYRYAQAEGVRGALKISWDDACLALEGQIRDLNKQIQNFNLKRPSENLEIFKLKLEEELARVGAPRWLK